ncbi:hypothetical protein SLEP1_g10461 [Rubroshorea leprosula]|uniref:Secreted peptide n=1 Tax=Rubroshorea leprosula TaxID=152421 RepID=A0AAV5II29_9ROSI|nr:hypothetical protein SLEP1_g10461 [Rubroshorea leprosula]
MTGIVVLLIILIIANHVLNGGCSRPLEGGKLGRVMAQRSRKQKVLARLLDHVIAPTYPAPVVAITVSPLVKFIRDACFLCLFVLCC